MVKTAVKSQIAKPYRSIIADLLQPHISQIFGYHALLYSPLSKELVANNLRIKNQIVLGRTTFAADLVCRFEELPIASDTIDFALLPCSLQTSENPHQLLREVERVLIPEGTAVIVGRNPWSWKGLINRYTQSRKQTELKVRDISRGRIHDWFRLLGFETEQEICISLHNQNVQQGRYYPWIKKLSQFACDFFGSYYIIIARKKVSTLTPIRSSWRRNKQMVPSRLAEPSVRNQVENWFEQIRNKPE